jgi:hypothetical protein
MAYGRRYGSARSTTTAQSGPRPNRYNAACGTCAGLVAAGEGILTGSRAGGYEVRHRSAVWAGSPVSGHWAGGCPEGEELEAARAAAPSARERGSKYAYTNSGARVTMSSRRCEDAPCCGCC